MLAVVRRSRCGYPQVVLTAPLLIRLEGSGPGPACAREIPVLPGHALESRRLVGTDGGPVDCKPEQLSVFPTQFWLTCPLLYEAISALEAEGWIQRWEERLQGDGALRQAMAEAHRGAAAFRLSLVPPAWREKLHDPRFRGHWSVLARSGVAGIREAAAGRFGGIKCLHAHYADWVGRGQNPVGEWVAHQLPERGVPEECDADCEQRCGPRS